MARLPMLVGAALLLAVPALAATTVTTTTTTVTQSVAPGWVAPPPAAVVVPPPAVVVPPPQTVIVPPAINSGASGVTDSDIGVGRSVSPTTEIWREYYRGPDGLVHMRTTTRNRAP